MPVPPLRKPRCSAVAAVALLLLSLAPGVVQALPGDLTVSMSLDETDLEAAPTESSDTVDYHGNVSFEQAFYQYASASITATLDRNWTVSVSPSTVSRRGPGNQAFTVSIEVPPTASGREVASLTVTAEGSTRVGDPQTITVGATLRVRSWIGYRVNATGPVEVIVPIGGTATLRVPLRNVGNEPEYFSTIVPYWYGLRPLGITIDAPSNVLVTDHDEDDLVFTIQIGTDAVPRAYVFDLQVKAQSLPIGGTGAQLNPRTVSVEALVTGASPSGNPYDGWTRGDPPSTVPAWESVFGSTELRRHPDIDNTGNRVTYDQSVDGERAIYLGDISGSSSMRLTRGHIDHNPVFSPNGHRIAFARDDDRIMVINLNGTELLEFGTDLGVVNITDWAPTGDRLLLDADGDIYELDITINSTRHLAGEPVDQWGAVYSPDGSRIFYISYEAAGRNPEIWSMGPDGMGHKQLTFNDLMERFVSVSPNGNKVAFTIEDGSLSGDRLCVMNPDGTEVRIFTDRSRSVYLLRWMPDGEGLLAEVSSIDTGVHDLGRVEYPWSDAGFQTEDGDGDGKGGGDSPWDVLGFISPILKPVPCLVILAVVGILGFFFYNVRSKEREKADKAAKLKKITGREDGHSPSAQQGPTPDPQPYAVQPYQYDQYSDGYDRRWR